MSFPVDFEALVLDEPSLLDQPAFTRVPLYFGDFSMLDKYFELVRREWEQSSAYRNLVECLERDILASPMVLINDAFCWSLGSMEMEVRESRIKLCRALDTMAGMSIFEKRQDPPLQFPPVLESMSLARPLYRLTVFETVLTYLRKKFDIRQTFVHGGHLTAADIGFLQRRGYSVTLHGDIMEAVRSDGNRCNLDALRNITSSTFLYIPSAMNNSLGIARAICEHRPSLCLTQDMFIEVPFLPVSRPINGKIAALISTLQFHCPTSSSNDFSEAFSSYVESHYFRKVPNLEIGAGSSYGFMMPIRYRNGNMLLDHKRLLKGLKSFIEFTETLRRAKTEQVQKTNKDRLLTPCTKTTINEETCALLEQTYEVVESAWEASLEHYKFVKTLEQRVSSLPSFGAKQAVFFGLESMEGCQPSLTSDFVKDLAIAGTTLDIKEDSVALPTHSNIPRNPSLHRLAVFKTIVQILRGRCPTLKVDIQCGSLTRTDREFLKRDYEFSRYIVDRGLPSSAVANVTFLYAPPYKVYDIAPRAITSLCSDSPPKLYLGPNLFDRQPWLLVSIADYASRFPRY